MRSNFNRHSVSLDVNNKTLENEVNIKIIKKEGLFNAYVFDLAVSEWKPLCRSYRSLDAVIEVMIDDVAAHALRLD